MGTKGLVIWKVEEEGQKEKRRGEGEEAEADEGKTKPYNQTVIKLLAHRHFGRRACKRR